MSHNYFKIHPRFLRKEERDFLISLLNTQPETSPDILCYTKHLRKNDIYVKYRFRRFKKDKMWGCLAILKNSVFRIKCYSTHFNKGESKELVAKMIWSELIRKATVNCDETFFNTQETIVEPDIDFDVVKGEVEVEECVPVDYEWENVYPSYMKTHHMLDRALISPKEKDTGDDDTKFDEEWNRLSYQQKLNILDEQMEKKVNLKRHHCEI